MSFPVTTRGPQTAADWTAANPTLDQFEVGIEINPATGAYERAKLGDGRTAWADLAYWNPSGGPKVYRALLSQTGTDAPVAVNVFEDTLPSEVVMTRVFMAGNYNIECSGAFPDSTKVMIRTNPLPDGDFVSITWADDSNLTMETYNYPLGIPTQADNILNCLVEIEVYP